MNDRLKVSNDLLKGLTLKEYVEATRGSMRGTVAGFTGTRRGMTSEQKRTVARLLLTYKATALHHGDCIGADAEVHVIAQALDMAIHLHPGNLPQWRANCALAGPGSLWPPKPPLERNGDIVAECDFLIAAPAEDRDQVRSGTWATIREARRQGRPVVLVLPNGTAQGSTGVAV